MRLLQPLEKKADPEERGERPSGALMKNTVTPAFTVKDGLSDCSYEKQQLDCVAKHCSRGWFSGKRTHRVSPAHGPAQVNVLVHEEWGKLARNHIVNKAERNRKELQRPLKSQNSALFETCGSLRSGIGAGSFPSLPAKGTFWRSLTGWSALTRTDKNTWKELPNHHLGHKA